MHPSLHDVMQPASAVSCDGACLRQGALAHVLATKLDARIREHLKLRSNLFSESASGLAGSLARPLLCLFDRNFELSVVSAVATREACLCPHHLAGN